MQLSAKIIRLAVDVAKIGQPIIDLNTQQTPSIFAGTDVQIQLALFNNGTLVDVGNLAYLQIDLKTPSNLLGASVLTQQVNASALNNAANFSTWTAGTAQQAVFALSNLQTNFGISTPATYTLIISGATTDSPGHIIVFGQTQFTVTPTGLNSGGSPPPATPNFYTTSQSDGRYVLQSNGSTNGTLSLIASGSLGGFIAAESVTRIGIAAGQSFGSGTWTAQQGACGLLRIGDIFAAYLNSGQTVGATPSQTLIMQVSPSGTLQIRDANNLDTPTLDAWGDSITAGNGASSPSVTAYVPLLVSGRGFSTLVNHCISGSQIQDQYQGIIQYSVQGTSLSTILTGYNDMRVFGSSTTNQQNYEDGLLAAISWLAIPDTKKVRANACVSTTGTWSSSNRWGISTSLSCSTTGGTMTFSVRGETVYLWGTRLVTGGGSFTVTVDGSIFGSWSCAGAGTSNLGSTYSPFLVRIANLPGGSHTVVVTTSSNSEVEVDACAGNEDANVRSGPYVYVGNCLRMNTAGYAMAPANGSDSVVSSINGRIAKVCQLLCADGLNVLLVDSSAHYQIVNVSSDNIHPGDAGHQQIADSFNRAMYGFVSPRDREGAICAVRQKITRLGSFPSLWVVDTIANQVGYGVYSPQYFLDFRQPVGSQATLHLAADGNDDGVYIQANGPGPSALIGAGAAYGGSNWVAKVSAPTILDIGSSGQVRVAIDSAKTVGSTYNPTFIVAISAAGLTLNGGFASGGAVLNGNEWINGASGLQIQGGLPSTLSGVGGEFEYNAGTVYVSAVNRNTTAQIPLQCRGSSVTLVTSGTTNLTCNGSNVILNLVPKFAGNNTTGSGSAALGSNCPASTSSAPYTWIQAAASDGSTVYLPAWK